MKIETIAKMMGVAVLIFFVGFFFAALFENNTSSSSLPQSISKQSSLSSEQEETQAVTLSWGKFNYNPEVITVDAGKPVRITADLTRLRGCFTFLIIPDLNVQKQFTTADPVLEFTPTEKGTYLFTCAMGMGKGTLIVQ